MLSLGDGIAIASVIVAFLGVFYKYAPGKTNGRCGYHSGIEERLSSHGSWIEDLSHKLEEKFDRLFAKINDIEVQIARLDK